MNSEDTYFDCCRTESALHRFSTSFLKRTIDIMGSTAGLFLLSPLLVVIALLVKYSSKGSMLFVQKRVGLHGKMFSMYKFRTMQTGAERELRHMPLLIRWDGPVMRIENDPRITRIGSILRRYCLDELPQFVNVFLGEMSLVGPRPHLPQEVEKYEPWHYERLRCKPGMTCFWQINNRHNVAFDDWIRMDLQYVRNVSVFLDFKIIVMTIIKMITHKNFRVSMNAEWLNKKNDEYTTRKVDAAVAEYGEHRPGLGNGSSEDSYHTGN